MIYTRDFKNEYGDSVNIEIAMGAYEAKLKLPGSAELSITRREAEQLNELLTEALKQPTYTYLFLDD